MAGQRLLHSQRTALRGCRTYFHSIKTPERTVDARKGLLMPGGKCSVTTWRWTQTADPGWAFRWSPKYIVVLLLKVVCRGSLKKRSYSTYPASPPLPRPLPLPLSLRSYFAAHRWLQAALIGRTQPGRLGLGTWRVLLGIAV